MTAQEFQSAFFTIEARWKKAYNGDQVALIKAVADQFTFEQFKTVCTRLLGSMRSAPMVPDFERTFQDMRFYPAHKQAFVNAEVVHRQEEDFLYRVRDNIWANNTHVFIRGDKPSFIIKADHPSNELVVEAEAVKGARIAEIKNHLKQNTYNRFIDKENVPMKTLDFSGFSA